ncbi:hypothetical protein [Kitasatospora sp. NPDC085464]
MSIFEDVVQACHVDPLGLRQVDRLGALARRCWHALDAGVEA